MPLSLCKQNCLRHLSQNLRTCSAGTPFAQNIDSSALPFSKMRSALQTQPVNLASASISQPHGKHKVKPLSPLGQQHIKCKLWQVVLRHEQSASVLLAQARPGPAHARAFLSEALLQYM